MFLRSWIVCNLFASVPAAWLCDSEHIHLCENVPVNIQIHGGIPVHNDDYILSANSDGKKLSLVPVDNSDREKFVMEPAGGKYHVKVVGGTSDERTFLSTAGNGHLDVLLWNRDDGSGNQLWDLQWSNGYWRFHQNINLGLREGQERKEEQDSNVELQGGHRRRRVKNHNLLETHSDSHIALGYDRGNGFQNWDIEPAGCYVLDPEQVTGRWKDLDITITCTDCSKHWDVGYIVNGHGVIDAYFSAKLKASMKAGLSLFGFGKKAKAKVEVREKIEGHLDASFVAWKENAGSITIHPEDKDIYFEKKVWQFVIEATDTCGQTSVTQTQQVAYTPVGHEPCCVAGQGVHVDYALCAGGEDSLMPGANEQSYCQIQSEADLAV